MSEQDEKAWADEQQFARKYIAEHLKMKGDIRWVDDGKDEFMVELTLKDMVTLLATYGVERMCDAVMKTFSQGETE